MLQQLTTLFIRGRTPKARRFRHAGLVAVTFLLAGGIIATVAASLPPGGAAGRTETDARPLEGDVLAELEAFPGAADPTPIPTTNAGTGGPLTEPQTVKSSSPLVKSALPLGALAASNFRPIAGLVAKTSSQEPPPPQAPIPWTVLVADDGRSAAMSAAVRTALQGLSVDARGSDNPGQPDAILVVTGGGGPSAWYCQSPGSGSSDLAGALVDALPPESASGSPGGFSCQSLQGRWPRTPAALLQLPSNLNGDEALAGTIADATRRYLDETGGPQRQTRVPARLTWPAKGDITSYFDRSHPLGIDIGQKTGPVVAATDGSVYFAGGNTCCSYGRLVVLDGPDGIRTIYGHLKSLAVKTGDRVKAGQTLGEVGCTGKCNGPHLHFEVIDNGVRNNPLTYLP